MNATTIWKIHDFVDDVDRRGKLGSRLLHKERSGDVQPDKQQDRQTGDPVQHPVQHGTAPLVFQTLIEAYSTTQPHSASFDDNLLGGKSIPIILFNPFGEK